MAPVMLQSELLRLESKTSQDRSRLLTRLAGTLRSAAAELVSEANKIYEEDECTRIKRAWFCTRESETEQEARKMIETRIIADGMSAANTLRQEQIIGDAVQAILYSIPYSPIEKTCMSPGHGTTVAEVAGDQILNFVCHLAAEMLVDREIMSITEKVVKDKTSLARDANCRDYLPFYAKLRTAGPEAEDSYVPTSGFVTASGWLAVNKSISCQIEVLEKALRWLEDRKESMGNGTISSHTP